MTKPIKSQTPSRPPVDTLQYEKLALSAFDLCDRQVAQLDTLITLASSIVRNPAVSRDERQRRQKLIELLLDTAEQYQQELECDRELFQVIALDAKGVPRSRITAHHATKLLAEASQRANASSTAADGKHIARQKRVHETRRLPDRKHHATARSRTTLSNGRNPRKPQTNRTSNKKQNAKKNGRSTRCGHHPKTQNPTQTIFIANALSR
ncbi:MAG: hypothetical protein ACJ8HC_22205 [Paraburkholderia graminis]|uniref:hypothetical protein n=1 Tax=Paraburkholderia graminis TaxID=60548 RepID=UPI00389AEE56